jgi:uncharacterized protein
MNARNQMNRLGKRWCLNVIALMFLTMCLTTGADVTTESGSLLQDMPTLMAKAEHGDALAQFNLGFLYEIGTLVPRDGDQAVAWYRKAAVQGFAEAQYTLGYFYAFGLIVPKNQAQAIAWYRKAAEQGHHKAQRDLGFCYVYANGVPKDDIQGLAWIRKAADQGDAVTQWLLGRGYAYGDGFPKDQVLGYMWLGLSAAHGQISGAEQRDILAKNMTSAQIAEAQRLILEWKPVAVTKSP